MQDTVVSLIQTAVAAWSRERFASDEVLWGKIALDDDEDRYLVNVAARPVGFWLVVEVWLEDGRVAAINYLGEGVPFIGAA